MPSAESVKVVVSGHVDHGKSTLIGRFVEVHVSTPIQVCSERDPKGLYKRAYSKEILHFTGVDDPYEIPSSPELRIDTDGRSVEDCVQLIMDELDVSLSGLRTNSAE